MIDFKKFIDDMAEDVSILVIDNLWRVNIRDYHGDELVQVAEYYSPQALIYEKDKVERFTAWDNRLLVGTVGLNKIPFDCHIPSHYVAGVFVRVSRQSQGIGQSLMEYIENYASNSGIRKLIIKSSITARDFYMKIGYRSENNGDGFNRKSNTYTLTKWLI